MDKATRRQLASAIRDCDRQILSLAVMAGVGVCNFFRRAPATQERWSLMDEAWRIYIERDKLAAQYRIAPEAVAQADDGPQFLVVKETPIRQIEEIPEEVRQICLDQGFWTLEDYACANLTILRQMTNPDPKPYKGAKFPFRSKYVLGPLDAACKGRGLDPPRAY
jgi:hypothetical protein